MDYYIEDFGLCEEVQVEEVQMKALKSERKINIDYVEGRERDIPERVLWINIIQRAVDDLFFLPQLRNTKPISASKQMQFAKNTRKSAYNFLFLNSPLFAEYRRFVFENAGIELVKMKGLRRRADRFEAENG